MSLYEPVTQNMKLDMRMNLKSKKVMLYHRHRDLIERILPPPPLTNRLVTRIYYTDTGFLQGGAPPPPPLSPSLPLSPLLLPSPTSPPHPTLPISLRKRDTPEAYNFHLSAHTSSLLPEHTTQGDRTQELQVFFNCRKHFDESQFCCHSESAGE
jgi:hypothetical protein